MRTLLARCCVLALIAGGYAFTGDAGRVFARGRRVLESTRAPQETAEPPARATAATNPSPAPSPPPESFGLPDEVPPAPPAPEPEARAGVATAAPEAVVSEAPPADAPIGTPIAPLAPPNASPEAIDLATLSPGDRVVVWVGRRGSRKGAAGTLAIAFDVIDPASAEVLEQRHTGSSESGANHAPYRRLRILGSATEGFLGGVTASGPAGRITRRLSLQLAPVESVQSASGEHPGAIETIGPVQAMAVTRATTNVP